jgi:hypothetical protein
LLLVPTAFRRTKSKRYVFLMSVIKTTLTTINFGRE